jgi:hypothetical protein
VALVCTEHGGGTLHLRRYDFANEGPATPILIEEPLVDLSSHDLRDCRDLELVSHEGTLWLAVKVDKNATSSVALYLWQVSDDGDPLIDGITVFDEPDASATLVELLERADELAVAYHRDAGVLAMGRYDFQGNELSTVELVAVEHTSLGVGASTEGYASATFNETGDFRQLLRSFAPDGVPRAGPLEVPGFGDLRSEPALDAVGEQMGIAFVDRDARFDASDGQVYFGRASDL